MAIEDKVDLLAGKLIELGEKMAEPATQAALAAVKINALQSVVGGTVALAISVGMAFAARAGWRWGVSTKWENDPAIGVTLISAFIGLAAGVVALIELANVWTWAPLFYPEAYLAKKILGL